MASISATTAAILSAVVSAASVGTSVYMQSEAAGRQKEAQEQATKQAQDLANKQEEATNKANKKTPDTGAFLAAAQQAAKAGGGSTMLTGPQGAAPGTLGSTNLLGS